MVKPRVVLVLGDQLTPTLSSLRAADPSCDVVLMAEVMAEAAYVPHHRRKLAFVFSAMRHFAEELRGLGWTVDYVRLDDPDNSGDLVGEARRALDRHAAAGLVMTEPGEWRLATGIAGWPDALGRPVKTLPDDRFLASKDEFARWADGRKMLRMEHFYRGMRRAHDVLMEDGEPAGGRWNYDAENRKKAPAEFSYPDPFTVEPDDVTRDVLAMVRERFADGWGDFEPFGFAVTRRDAERAADRFFEHALPHFGDHQDAMLDGQRFLHHSVLSHYLNVGLLDPLDLCRRAEAEWREGRAPLNAVEGYVRQILGWREYVRGIYWLEGPDYVRRNHLGARRALPAFYWSGETDMACVRAVVTQTREDAYAHHIQRLMVTGTFGLIAGVDPFALHEWYLSVYVDAFEWVEAPNVIGMSQFADGGRLGSKPYAASGAYIDRMSDHCRSCRYDVKTKAGAEACPFNPLYWDFMIRNREVLEGNPRLSRAYSTWDRMSGEKRGAALSSAAEILGKLDAGERV